MAYSIPSNDLNEVATMGFGFFQGWNACGQTFTPDHDYVCAKILFRITRWEDARKGWARFLLTQTGGDCWNETILESQDFHSDDLESYGSLDWHEFTIPNISLVSGVTYRIIIHTFGEWWVYTAGAWARWDVGASLSGWRSALNEYARGSSCYGCNFSASSGSWTLSPTNDQNFIVYEIPIIADQVVQNDPVSGVV